MVLLSVLAFPLAHSRITDRKCRLCRRSSVRIAHEIERSVDTSTAAGRAFYGMLPVFAAFETDVCRERQLEGIDDV